MRLLLALLAVCGLMDARNVRVKLYSRSKPEAAVLHELSAKYRVDQRRIVAMPLEDYVAHVLAGEVSTLTSFEALRAMAVSVRTYALYHLGRHEAEGYDLCDTTHCQDLRLDVDVRASLREAADSTEGQILRYGRDAAATFYHRHCGGNTAAAREVWPALDLSYLPSQTDSFCVRQGAPRWNSEVRTAEFPVAPQIIDRTPSGRVARIDLASRIVTAEQFASYMGERFGWNVLRSSRYTITHSNQTVRFAGIGHGHGVGLCQVGAQARGEAGHDFRRILAFYYPGTKLGWASGSEDKWVQLRTAGAEVSAPDEASARELASLIDRAVSEAQRLGLPTIQPRVRTYPTIARYRDATGAEGWVAGTTVGRTIRLQPLTTLRSNGVLYDTVLHELLHMAIDSTASVSTPDWFREGLVLALSRENGGRAASTEAPQNVREFYRRAEQTTRSLLQRHGRPTLLGWLRSGLPPEVTHAVGARQLSPPRRAGPIHNP